MLINVHKIPMKLPLGVASGLTASYLYKSKGSSTYSVKAQILNKTTGQI